MDSPVSSHVCRSHASDKKQYTIALSSTEAFPCLECSDVMIFDVLEWESFDTKREADRAFDSREAILLGRQPTDETAQVSSM